MENREDLNVDKVCRTCLTESLNMVPLTSKIKDKKHTLLDGLAFVSMMAIKMNKSLPNQICVDCEVMLCKAEEFKQRCIKSEKVLSKMLKTKQSQRSVSIKKVIKKEKASIVDVKPPANITDNNLVEDFFESLKTDVPITFEGSAIGGELFSKIEFKEDIKEEISGFSDNENDALLDSDKDTIKVNLDGIKLLKTDSIPLNVDSKNCIKEKKLVYNKTKMFMMPIKCELCNVIFKNERTFLRHKKTHKPQDYELPKGEYLQCSSCMRKFKTKTSLITHIKNHEIKDNIKFTCNTCKREFKHQAHLDNHVISVHNKEKGFSCDNCLAIYPTESELLTHKLIHKDEKRHQCSMCSKSFTMLSTLTDHMRTHTGEKPYLCSVCGRGFSQKTNLAQHMRRHLGLKPYKCKECERGFVSKGELDAHMRTHSGAHPFVCDDCGGGFTTSSSLVKHRRIHTGERPYACDLCSMRFSASGTLRNHRRTHTGEKPYHCSYCEKAFVQRQDLVSHIRCHTGERPYVCSHCGQSFRKASGLKVHVKMHKEPTQGTVDVGMMKAVVPRF